MLETKRKTSVEDLQREMRERVCWKLPTDDSALVALMDEVQTTPSYRLKQRWQKQRELLLKNYQSKGVARLKELRAAGWEQKPVDSKTHSERMKTWWAERKARQRRLRDGLPPLQEEPSICECGGRHQYLPPDPVLEAWYARYKAAHPDLV
jgi:hypothetical protein